MRMKRMLAMLMALCLLLSNAPTGAFAAETVASGTCGDNLTWTLDSDGLLTISGEGEMGYAYFRDEYTDAITAVVIEEGVTNIGNAVFAGCQNLKSVSVADTVTNIDSYAFQSCHTLTDIDLGNGVTHLGEGVFLFCSSLTSITIPGSVTSIGGGLFEGCTALEEVILSDGLTSLGAAMFDGCTALRNISIPASVTSIPYSAFFCDNLEGIWVDEANAVYCSDSHGVLYSKDMTQLIKAPDRLPGSYSVPEGVTEIGVQAFNTCWELTSVSLPDTLLTIGDYAFKHCAVLEAITIPASVTNLGKDFFSGYIWVDEANTAYSSDSYGVLFDKAMTHLLETPKQLSGDYVIPDGVVTVEESAFRDGITSVVFPATVKTIGDSAFSYCDSLTKIYFRGDAPEFGSGAFNGVVATVYYLRDREGWTEEERPSFYGGMLKWVACENMEIVASGEDNGLFWTLDTDGLLTVSGEGEMGNYMEDGAPWYDYLKNIKTAVIEDGVTNIGGWAFALCENMESITIADTVTTIDENAFWKCSDLTSVNLPENLLSIGSAAFTGCSSLVSIAIPDQVTMLNSSAFSGCTGLTSVTLPENLMSICSSAFSNCTSLTSVTLPETVEDIGSGAFSGCHSLESIYIPAGVISIGDSAFSNCFVLDNVTLPEGLTRISANLFYGCDTLSSITVPKSVTEIAENAFLGCFGLRKLLFLGDAPTIGEDAFAEVVTRAYYPASNVTWTEEVMQQYGGELTWIAYGGETEELFTLSGTSVSLYDSLDMHFVMDPANVAEGYYVVLTRYYADGRADHTATVPFRDWRSLSDGRLYVTYSGIAAKEMGDYVEITVYNGNGEAVSEVYVDSVKTYAMRMLGKEEVIANEELRTLYVDMLNYGAAAQAQFGYNVTMPANDLLTEEQQSYATASCVTEDDLVKGTGRAGTALTLKNRISLDMIFTNSAIGNDHTGLYAIATYFDHYDDEVKIRIDDIKAYGSNYGYVSIPSLVVADYCQPVTVTVYDAQGNALAWATDSIEGYAHRMAGKLPEMVEAIVKFGTSAYNYFH